ncbi:ArsR/SmtB family transcription factor [Kitasatospora sp. NPDC051853]|uniref:ArsR/SmtB family transcription factor n=1 Tax=Kitasatospora sp. NPDC051853 TaxID=3364058 RepID=UPI0037B1269B
MLRIHFTPRDFTRVTLAPRPAPLQELNAALTTVCRPDTGLLHDLWRRRALRALPRAAAPLADLVPHGRAPAFLDVLTDHLPDALDEVRRLPPGFAAAELERVHPATGRAAPGWVRDLHQDVPQAWEVLRRAQHAAFDALLAPVWDQVQDLHHAEFVHRAVQLAHGGTAALLTGLVPGARLDGHVWHLPGPPADIHLGGRGLLLLPTFHRPGPATHSDLPDRPGLPGRPVAVTYPAGPPLPPTPRGPAAPEPLTALIGRTRTRLLRLLTHEHTITELARLLGVSAATVSAHTAALREAGLITTTRSGRAVLHHPTALAALLLRR